MTLHCCAIVLTKSMCDMRDQVKSDEGQVMYVFGVLTAHLHLLPCLCFPTDRLSSF